MTRPSLLRVLRNEFSTALVLSKLRWSVLGTSRLCNAIKSSLALLTDSFRQNKSLGLFQLVSVIMCRALVGFIKNRQVPCRGAKLVLQLFISRHLIQGVGLAGRDRQRGFRSANQTPSPLRIFGIRGRTSPTVHHAIDIGRPPGDP